MARKNPTIAAPAKTTRPLKPKPYLVTTPKGETLIVFALTLAGAISRAKAAQEPPQESWHAELASGEAMFNAAKNGTTIIDAPATLDGVEVPGDDQQQLPMGSEEGGQ